MAHTLIEFIHKNLGPRALWEWAMHSLYRSFATLTMLGGGFFEVEFTDEVGRLHALSKQYRIYN
jgi:hypothetical protein